MLELLQSQAKEMAKMNVSIYLAWIPGHSGIEGNERVDKLAKDMCKGVRCPPLFLLSNLIDAGWL